MSKFVDDKFDYIESDIMKLRLKSRMYISFSNEAAAKALSLEIIYNAIDEMKNPRSPASKIDISFDESTQAITCKDDGRGIPLNDLEKILTSLNSGSNISSEKKSELKVNILGTNGVGTIAFTALGEITEVTSYRGGTENKFKRLVFHEGEKVEEEERACSPNEHGLTVMFKPSKILGKNTRIVWSQIREELVNLQYLSDSRMKMKSKYIDKHGREIVEDYKTQPFESLLTFRNNKQSIISDKVKLRIEDDNLTEEIGGKKFKRFIHMDIAFAYTDNTINPYIDSFCNTTCTIDAGSHLDGSLEGLCRYFQQVTKSTLSDRDKLDIKWDDVKLGLSFIVSLSTNFESIYTSQTKHKVSSEELEKLLRDKTIESLQKYFKAHPNQLRDMINIVKTNAKARRESDKTRSAVMKESLSNNWAAYKMKNYDPCTNKGKEYKELYVIEGDSAKGSLKLSRDPKFQALFAIRGVSANVFKLDLNGILENREFNDLIKVLGCNIASKFDLNKLQFNKIIIASDADTDGLGIRSLLCSFFFKVFPEIIEDGRLFIAEPPLYRIADKKNPFVINKEDYLHRYIKEVMKEYKIGYVDAEDIHFMNNTEVKEFLSMTSSYVDDLSLLAQHYKINERLLEMILEELAMIEMHHEIDKTEPEKLLTFLSNPQGLINRIQSEFPEILYDDNDHIFKGIIDGRYQTLELSERLCKKGWPLIKSIQNTISNKDSMILQHIKSGATHRLSLLGTLKILKKFQPDILHYFKGLAENQPEDLEFMTMNPNTRSIIKVHIHDLENDMKVFQVLRGTSPADSQARKLMMKNFKISREMLST